MQRRYLEPPPPASATVTLRDAVATLIDGGLGRDERAAILALIEQADTCWRTPKDWAADMVKVYDAARATVLDLARKD